MKMCYIHISARWIPLISYLYQLIQLMRFIYYQLDPKHSLASLLGTNTGSKAASKEPPAMSLAHYPHTTNSLSNSLGKLQRILYSNIWTWILGTTVESLQKKGVVGYLDLKKMNVHCALVAWVFLSIPLWAVFRDPRSHLEKPGMGDRLLNWFILGNSICNSRTTLLIK